MKNKKISLGNGFKNLRLWCRHCRFEIKDVCKETPETLKENKPISKCRFYSEHSFKAIAFLEGGKRMTKILSDARSLNEAIPMAIAFVNEAKSHNRGIDSNLGGNIRE